LEAELSCLDDPSRILKGAEEKAVEQKQTAIRTVDDMRLYMKQGR
jgi:hypothetical protein